MILLDPAKVDLNPSIVKMQADEQSRQLASSQTTQINVCFISFTTMAFLTYLFLIFVYTYQFECSMTREQVPPGQRIDCTCLGSNSSCRP